MPIEEMYTLREVAEQTRSSIWGVRLWVRDEKLRAIRVGSQLRVTKSALEEFIRRSTDENGGEAVG